MNIYLDNNATTKTDPAVLEAMLPYLGNAFGNPSSVHEYGQDARFAVDKARMQVAELINAEPEEIVFTSGGTEACNTALAGHCRGEYQKGRKKAELLIGGTEHPAVMNCAEYLAETNLAEMHILSVDKIGVINLSDFEHMCKSRQAGLVSLMHANNDTGAIQPIREAAAIAHKQGLIVYSDAVQAVGKIQLDVKKLDVDLLSCSAHKFHGPKGIGALYIKRGIKLKPLLFGGPQEARMRAGTENVAAIAGFGAACMLAGRQLQENSDYMLGLRKQLESGLRSLPGADIFAYEAQRLPGTVYARFEGIQGEALQMALDMNGFSVSTGSACSAESREPSHVLLAMGVRPEHALGAVRFSLGKYNSKSDISSLLAILERLLAQMRK